jgi:hypothetical protein
MMKPTIGRIVHYTPDPPRPATFTGPWAALVVFVADITQASLDPEENEMPLVNLSIFHPEGDVVIGRKGVRFTKAPTPGCWSWPPRT